MLPEFEAMLRSPDKQLAIGPETVLRPAHVAAGDTSAARWRARMKPVSTRGGRGASLAATPPTPSRAFGLMRLSLGG